MPLAQPELSRYLQLKRTVREREAKRGPQVDEVLKPIAPFRSTCRARRIQGCFFTMCFSVRLRSSSNWELERAARGVSKL
jgi:hypothetical protein